MDYKVLYRKYRPDSFKNVMGQDYTISILKNAIINDKIAHAYIFNGPRGTGKTSTAKIFAKTINCENPIDGEACGKCNSCTNIGNNPDIIEIDAASNNGVDEIRELINNIKIAPSYSKYKVYIIDEVHMMTQSAFNALLLTLEEPPKHVVFILATTNIESVPITILSRCQKFDFKKISTEVIKENITNICKKEKITIEDDAISEIAYLSEGGMRDALSILDQLSSENQKITLDLIINNFGSVPTIIIDGIVEALNQNDITKLKENLQKLESGNVDYKVFIKKLIDKLANLAFNQNELNNLDLERIKNIIFDLVKIINNYNININPFILIELTLLEYMGNINQIEQENVENVDKIISREIISEVKIEKNNTENTKEEVKVVKKEKITTPKQEISFDKKTRINNCFVDATKDYLKEAQSKLKNIIKNNKDNKFLLSMIEDSDVVAASGTYYIFSSPLDSIINLINMNHKTIEKELENIRIVGLTEEEWTKEKEEYISNKKNKIKYTLIEEQEEPEEVESTINEELNTSMEDIAESLFSSSKIEVE